MKSYDILILASFPAPYRVEVFNLLAKNFKILVFWENGADQSRNPKYYSQNFLFDCFFLSDSYGKRQFKEVKKKIKDFKLFLAYDWYLKNSICVQFKCLSKDVPYIVNCDGAFIKHISIKDILKRFLISHAKYCFASGYNAKKYFLYYGAKNNNIVLHNFTSLYKKEILLEQISSVKKNDIKNKLKLPLKTTFISIGQFIERKGFIFLIEAWSKINNDEKQLLIIGGGPLKDEYLEYIKINNIQNIFILDYMDHDKIVEYYKAADYFVFPTLEDIWGLVINEAMAYGLPIITTDKCIAGIELLNKSNGGLIVKSASSLELEDALNKILTMDYNKMSLSNLKCIYEYTYENVAFSHTKIIKKIIEGEDYE